MRYTSSSVHTVDLLINLVFILYPGNKIFFAHSIGERKATYRMFYDAASPRYVTREYHEKYFPAKICAAIVSRLDLFPQSLNL